MIVWLEEEREPRNGRAALGARARRWVGDGDQVRGMCRHLRLPPCGEGTAHWYLPLRGDMDTTNKR